jgi:hypothetical protein
MKHLFIPFLFFLAGPVPSAAPVPLFQRAIEALAGWNDHGRSNLKDSLSIAMNPA